MSEPGEGAPASLNVPLHPLLIMFLCLGIALGFRWLKPLPLSMNLLWHQILQSACFLVGFALGGWSIWTLHRRGTSPEFGEVVRVLVCTGPYRFSRNPLFITNALLYSGLALTLDDAWAIGLLPILVLALDRLVICREERFLAERFGEAYAEYCRRVHRWI